MRLLRWLAAILLLPGMVLGVIPALLLLISAWLGMPADVANIASGRFWIAIVIAARGMTLALWTTSLFYVRDGDGTPAPWDPIERFIVRGPYRHVRNPMILGVILVLCAMAVYLASWCIAGWAVVFFIGNTIYFARSEEPGLRRRLERNTKCTADMCIAH